MISEIPAVNLDRCENLYFLYERHSDKNKKNPTATGKMFQFKALFTLESSYFLPLANTTPIFVDIISQA